MTDDKNFAPRSDERGVDREDFARSNDETSASGSESVGFVAGDQGDASGRALEVPVAVWQQKLQRAKIALRARLGEEVVSQWFKSLDFHAFDGRTLKVTVPVKFLRNWIQSHYEDAMIACAAPEFPGIERVEVMLRQPSAMQQKPPVVVQPATRAQSQVEPRGFVEADAATRSLLPPAQATQRHQVNGLEGSPLDPRYTFESFVVGPSNRMAHAGAVQVAETVFAESRGFNPLVIHSGVGHGKSHLLHAIAWEARRKTPAAKVLYLTAERFRFTFVEALRASDAMAFKDRFRSIDMLLIDDLEFMTGEKTELEFEHIINMLLDSGRQLVVASARPPAQLARLNDRMRSRLQRGLVTEIGTMDQELRVRILERRIQEKRIADPSFEVPREVVQMVADRLTESARELEGAITRLYAQWQFTRSAVTLDGTESLLRDLVSTGETRRIRIEDILRIVSRHYGVSKNDILSERRHRSVVWPRQIGMYLAKQMTARSLPEIGRRFGNRDHTTVLHAIRKIEGQITGNTQLKEEIDELKKLLGQDFPGASA